LHGIGFAHHKVINFGLLSKMTIVPPKDPGGRPRAVIDLLAVERAASIGCPNDDIAAIVGVSRRTLYEHMESDPAVVEAIERGRSNGRASVRRMQWMKAEAGSDTMLIWVGKVLCGQKDTSSIALTGANGGPVQTVNATVEIPANDPIEAARVYQKLMSGDG
jgi:hypothetical protein